MIDQVLYRRTVEQGYNEYCSRGLSKEQAHNVNLVMDAVASDIDDLGSGADSPFMLYPFENMHRVCLATFQREFSKGRSNSVNHGLLIKDDEYRELIKNPEQIWGFTNKNFLSRKVNHREQMFELKALDISENPELNKDFMFQEYQLNNDGYKKLLNAIYTTLSKNKGYKCGLRIDNTRDANKVMRHLGYLIMSMLPYELRDRISFCSRSVPDNIGITVQILNEKDSKKVDITYDLDTGKCTVNKESLEITDFYLNDLLTMSDAALRDYFGILATFKEELKITKNSEAEYVVSKLLKLSTDPSMFETEKADAQIKFINDVFLLPTSNKDVINSIVVRLLPYVDPKHYMEAFNINYGLYSKLDANRESDRKIMDQIEKNLIHNYKSASSTEREQLFALVVESEETHNKVYDILKEFVEINELDTDILLVDKYIQLYEEFFASEWKSNLYWKINKVFKQSDLSGKQMIWNRMYNSTNSNARADFLYRIVEDEEEQFYKTVFNDLVKLYIGANNLQRKERFYTCIKDVLLTENDEYRLSVLQEYNDVDEIEDPLWFDAYRAIEDLQKAASNIEFLKCLRGKYYSSSNPQIRNLYLEYIESLPVTELESIICQYAKNEKTNERDDQLLDKVISCLIKGKKKVSSTVLKKLANAVKDEKVDKLASYISTVYLSTSSDSSMEIYDFLEREQERIYHNAHLNKESLSSYDRYCAAKLDKRILNDDKELVETLQYLEKLKYHEESFKKTNGIYLKWIEQELTPVGKDYERYLKCKKICDSLNCIVHTQFGKQYYSKLKAKTLDGFWSGSSAATFDYEHCDIYKSNSVIFDKKFENHENHKLAESISGLCDGSYIDWDKVYETLLTKKHIPQDDIRNRIIKNFIDDYNNNGMSVSDLDYIAFICTNKNNLRVDYSKLFNEMQRFHYQIN